ncbi:MAG: HI0074 family nucleotidyltransferase substrate-binding subunit [Roseburia sp.]|nr:HI0074 family nucleotidyltransferase substrate-binding subunit [Roseburia sp.]
MRYNKNQKGRMLFIGACKMGTMITWNSGSGWGRLGMSYNLTKRVEEDIAALARRCGLKQVILFGSRARGENRERSDIDLAIRGGNTAEFIASADDEIYTLLMFDICFAQAWKAMKEILADQGYSAAQTGSPRQILKLAYSAGMVQDEEKWLAMLASRNEVSHSYNEEIALGLMRLVRADYIGMFEELKAELEEKWLR